MSATRALLTAEALERLPRDPLHRYELVRGELVTMTPVGGEHGVIAARFAAHLLLHVDQGRLGLVMVETGYRLESNPDTIRSPDVSFVATARISPGELPKGFIPGAPDLAVEVVSPDDVAAEVEAKVQEYRAHGVRMVLVVHPRTRTVTVYRPDGTARVLRSGEVIDCTDVVAGFILALDTLFAR